MAAALRYLSLFSGVGGFDLGLDRAGMVCVGQVEWDESCRSVLARHWPDVRRISDVRDVSGDEFGPIDLVCGGFPCQPHSLAGKRRGSSDERDMWPEFARIIRAVRPRWVVAENVPGLLSSESGRYFGGILRDLAGVGYDVAWRVLDAQFFGVPHRRRRVFIVGHLGDVGCAGAVLFEPEGGAGNSAPGRRPRPELARDIAACLRVGGPGSGRPLSADHGLALAPMVMAHGQANAEVVKDGSPSLTTNHEAPIVAFAERTRAAGVTVEHQVELAYALTNPGSGGRSSSRNIAGAFGVRRLTPRECERLQGFPDDWTATGLAHPSAKYIAQCARKGQVPPEYVDQAMSDTVRYRQMGNAVAVPVIEWIGRRIMSTEVT